jgi:hypothetical protein
MSSSRSSDAADPAQRPEVGSDPAANRAADQAKAALDNVRQGHEEAPAGAAGQPSWPTGGNVSQGPKDRPGKR